jgi:small GTP-binding protein
MVTSKLSKSSKFLPKTGNRGIRLAKVSIIGTPAVGKTTLTKLIRGQQISGRYNPTMGFNLKSANIDEVKFSIWDFGGQKQFLKQHLTKYIHGSDIIFLVTDSTPKNVLTTRELLDHTRNLVDESCEIVVIANKQDLPDSLQPEQVEYVLQTYTFPLVAIDKNNRTRMVELINLLMNYVRKRKQGGQ